MQTILDYNTWEYACGRSRPVAVPGEHVGVRAAAEPQQAERPLHAPIVGLHGVRDVAVLVGPVRRPWQGALAAQQDSGRQPGGGRALEPLGSHKLRGFAAPQNLYTIPSAPSSAA